MVQVLATGLELLRTTREKTILGTKSTRRFRQLDPFSLSEDIISLFFQRPSKYPNVLFSSLRTALENEVPRTATVYHGRDKFRGGNYPLDASNPIDEANTCSNVT